MKTYELSFIALVVGFFILWATLAVTTLTDMQALAQCEQIMSADACQYTLIK